MKWLLTLSLLFILIISYSQSKQKEIIVNKTIITLYKAGFGKDILIQKIRTSECSFNLSTDSLIILKKAGIPDEVIDAMMNPGDSEKQATEQNPSQKTDDSFQSGIYYCEGKPCKLIQLDASLYSQSKLGSGILTRVTYGIAKTKAKAILNGNKANMEVNEYEPTFYFYFDKGSAGNLGNTGVQNYWFGSASTPNEFILVKFEVNRNKSREVVTGSFGSYSGISSGIEEKNKIAFTYEKVSQGVYKVSVKKPLEAGQYCFMYAGGTGLMYGSALLQKVYDFGVK